MSNSFRTCTTDFNFESYLVAFLTNYPFWSEISRRMGKYPTMDIPTACVTFNPKDDEFQLWFNPEWLRKHQPFEILGVLMHEFSHITFGHLSARRKQPNLPWNYGTDCAINSIIDESFSRENVRALPEVCLIPGKRPHLDPELLAKMKPEDRKYSEDLAAIIEGLPKLKASEFYFSVIMKQMQDAGHDMNKKKIMIKIKGAPGEGQPGGGDGEPGDEEGEGQGIGEMDSHEFWDDIPEELREYVENKARNILEKAAYEADKSSKGWGNMPSEVIAEIRRSVLNTVDWRSVLRQFVGTMVRGERRTSIKRINRKYPYIHPGVKRGYTARLLIAVDQSGSVHDEMLSEFYAELTALTKRVTVDIMPFDCAADEKDIVEWRKGTSPRFKRVRMGGTDFNAPTAIVNDPKNRGRWDGLLICTDGEAPEPNTSRIKRGWVIGSGQKLYFNSNEIQVFVDKSKALKGSWR